VNKCERTKLRYERVSRILVNVKAGIEHLYEKLEFIKVISINLSKSLTEDQISLSRRSN